MVQKAWLVSLSFLMMTLTLGCSSTESSWGSGEVPGIGMYSAPPPGIQRKRLGVVDFKDKTGGKERGMAAADQMFTLLIKSRRFRVIERTRLKEILKEQDMEGIVNPDQMAQSGQVKGVELMCFGAITDFEIKHTKTRSGGGVLRGIGKIAGVSTGLSGIDIDFKKDKLDFHVGVDIRLVDTTTGEAYVAESADMRRSETASGMGLSLVGISIGNDGSIEIDNENQGRLLRLALDEALKKMLPQIDEQYARGWQ